MLTVISGIPANSIAVYNYMHALMVRGWWNFSRLYSGSNASLVLYVNCIDSDSHSVIFTIYILGTVIAMVNLKQFYTYDSNLCRN